MFSHLLYKQWFPKRSIEVPLRVILPLCFHNLAPCSHFTILDLVPEKKINQFPVSQFSSLLLAMPPITSESSNVRSIRNVMSSRHRNNGSFPKIVITSPNQY